MYTCVLTHITRYRYCELRKLGKSEKIFYGEENEFLRDEWWGTCTSWPCDRIYRQSNVAGGPLTACAFHLLQARVYPDGAFFFLTRQKYWSYNCLELADGKFCIRHGFTSEELERNFESRVERSIRFFSNSSYVEILLRRSQRTRYSKSRFYIVISEESLFFSKTRFA